MVCIGPERRDLSSLARRIRLGSDTIPLMDPLRELGRLLLVLGVLLAAIGALLYFGGRLPFRLGRLPGDIISRGEHTTFYFPIVTCLLLSAGLTLLFWLIGHFRR